MNVCAPCLSILGDSHTESLLSWLVSSEIGAAGPVVRIVNLGAVLPTSVYPGSAPKRIDSGPEIYPDCTKLVRLRRPFLSGLVPNFWQYIPGSSYKSYSSAW